MSVPTSNTTPPAADIMAALPAEGHLPNRGTGGRLTRLHRTLRHRKSSSGRRVTREVQVGGATARVEAGGASGSADS